MSLDVAMLTGVSGINAFGNAMNVIGDNIANVNTYGFKGSTAQFADILSASLTSGGGSMQLGRGTSMAGVNTAWSQGSFQTTGNSTDVAVQGAGFFVVKDPNSGTPYYSRDGQLIQDKSNNLVDSSGDIIQGYNMVAPTGVSSNISFTNMLSNAPKASTNFTLGANLNTNATITPAANITTTAGSANITLGSNGTTYAVGSSIQFLSSGAMPGGLSPNTPYYVVSNSGGATPTIQVSATQGGAAITVTSAGTKTNSIISSPPPAPAYSTTITLYDAQGNSVNTTMNFFKTAVPSNITAANVSTDFIYQIVPPTGMTVTGGSGTLEFNGTGTLVGVNSTGGTLSTTNPTGITITEAPGGANPLALTWSTFDSTGAPSLTSYSSPSATLSLTQDGYSAGNLTGLSVDTKGVITGSFSNGQTQKLYQFQLANFPNTSGLTRKGGSLYAATQASGQALTGTAGAGGLGTILGNSLELSNVDLASEFVAMVKTQSAYVANSKIITMADTLMQQTIQIVKS